MAIFCAHTCQSESISSSHDSELKFSDMKQLFCCSPTPAPEPDTGKCTYFGCALVESFCGNVCFSGPKVRTQDQLSSQGKNSKFYALGLIESNIGLLFLCSRLVAMECCTTTSRAMSVVELTTYRVATTSTIFAVATNSTQI